MPPSAKPTPLEALQQLPTAVRDFLFDQETVDQFNELTTRHGVREQSDEDEDEFGKISSLVGDIDLGFRKLSDLVPALVKELNWPPERAKKFAADVAGFRYLPIAGFLNESVWAQIEMWGADPKTYPPKKVEARFVTPDMLTEEIARDARLTLTPRLLERLKFLINSRLKGVREDLELKTMMTRAEKVGGTEISETDAERILSILHLKLANAKIVEQMPVVEQRTENREQSQKKPNVPTPVTEKPTLNDALPAAKKFAGPSITPQEEIKSNLSSSGEAIAKTRGSISKNKSATVLPEDEKEIEELRADTLKKLPPAPTIDYKNSVESILRASTVKLADQELGSRLRGIIDARLRDLRDSQETRELLMQPSSKNGLGLSAEDAAQLSRLVEAEFTAIKRQLETSKQREFEAFKQSQTVTRAARDQMEKRDEESAKERRFVETLKKSKTLKGIIPPPTAVSKKPPPTPPRTKLPSPSVTPVLSPASIPPSRELRPRIEDVKFDRRTAGPAEELRAMTIVEFRRLGRDAKDRTAKIKSRIDLLKDQSLEAFQKGVQGWLQSEPNRAYLSLARAALESGNAVTDIISKRTTANQPTLTLEEFQSILALNSSLRG